MYRKFKDFGTPGTSFFSAIKENDIKTVRRALKKNPDLMGASDGYHSPLSKAATLGHYEIVELLLEYGADIAERYVVVDNNKYIKWCLLIHLMSVVSKPCTENHVKVGELLIDHGSNVNSYDFFEETPLRYAVENDNVGWAEFLLKNGARLNSLQGINTNPVAHICSGYFTPESCRDMLILLVKYGLRTDCKTKRGDNFLHQFIDYSCDAAAEVAGFLISRGVSVNECDKDGRSPLIRSIEGCNFRLALTLINNGADVNCKDKSSRESPLHVACEKGNDELVDLLIRRGADISARNKGGATPFSKVNKNQSANWKVMVREFSRLSFENVAIFKNDMVLILNNPVRREYFQRSLVELDELSSTKFYGHHSYYYVLRMGKNIQKLAKFTQNEAFIQNFKANLYKFNYYKEDLRKIMVEALQARDNFKASYIKLCALFCDYLPDIILRKLADNLTLEDLPLL